MAGDIDTSFTWLYADLICAKARGREERDRIEQALRRARLPLTTVALGACLLARLSHRFEAAWHDLYPHDYALCVAVSCLWLAQRSMDDAPYNLRSWVEVVANNALTQHMLQATEALIFR